ncbi:Chaperone protein ClpB [Candidatus Portiera aleyrodidarum]|uniref:ATP-dependent chaperone protein ClpB n=1 Tax=Candidatus Portiera aleyrodidarum TV TaxID=1297582 RepID=A0A8D3X7B5_9GAMM|nr:AAA family ATPase [Candidatus Portiera aleyrodidarum]AGI27094.1 ATP-dependent chaperone protein ClpB [Candidatus Portiera aleyrodidarum TV]CEI59060.1 Chaperone protein ClpB [Candidatus Portiera aleyrodidarum]
MRLDRLTNKLKNALYSAKSLAIINYQKKLHTVHILLTLIKEDIFKSLIIKNGGDIITINKYLQLKLSLLPKLVKVDGKVLMGKDVIRLFNLAYIEAKIKDYKFIYSELVLLAALKLNNKVSKLLINAGLNKQKVKLEISQIIGGNDIVFEKKKEKYIRDLTKSASEGKLDSVIGREEEIRRIIQVLQRRKKNNPLLIGEKGVGKTAILEGLANRILNGEVPESIKNKKVFSIDMGALMVEAKYEERIKELRKKEGRDVLLFIDNIVSGFFNMLKPVLYRGDLHCIGATTVEAYRKYIEKDYALERRFQKIKVDEHSEEDTIAILRGLKKRYEIHHSVKITDGAIIAAAKLSNRYITDRKLPVKAMDLIDEAASRISIEIDYKPEIMEKMERHLIKLKIEREAIKRENDKYYKKILKILENKIKELSKEYSEVEKIWKTEKYILKGTAKLKREGARRNKDIVKLSERIPTFKKANNILNLLRSKLTEEEIAEVVSRLTGIPMAKILEGEREKIIKMEEVLQKRVIGQSEAVQAVSNAVRRRYITRIIEHNKNKGSFLFLGPKGVGKTELCKALAEIIFNTEESIVRINMSEFMDKYSVIRLRGELTEKVRIKPYSVILLNEIEKAHTDIYKILLLILKVGILTDGKGQKIDFRKTILVMTSNLGYEVINRFSGETYNERKLVVMELVNVHLKSEIINIIDEIVVFNSLFINQINNIAYIKIKKLIKSLAIKKLQLEISQDAIEKISRMGFNTVYGAKHLKKAIQNLLENPLSKAILYGKIITGDRIKVIVEKDQIVFSKLKFQ